MADTPEAKTKHAINEYLNMLSPLCWYTPFFGAGYTRKGIPDILGCYKGRFFALEVKAPSKFPSPWQIRELAGIDLAGGLAQVVYSVEEVKLIIAKIDAKL